MHDSSHTKEDGGSQSQKKVNCFRTFCEARNYHCSNECAIILMEVWKNNVHHKIRDSKLTISMIYAYQNLYCLYFLFFIFDNVAL